MSAVAEGMREEVVAALADSLARERQLARVYRQQTEGTWSPRVRRLWEEGLTVKRGHHDALTRLLTSGGGTPSAEAAAQTATPLPREVLSWVYEQERLLALRYRDAARHALDPDTERTIGRLADEQDQLLERVRATYRDYSAA
jgi:rubrerythrin